MAKTVETPRFNAETLAAIEEVREMKRNPQLCKCFDSVEALLEELNSDDDDKLSFHYHYSSSSRT